MRIPLHEVRATKRTKHSEATEMLLQEIDYLKIRLAQLEARGPDKLRYMMVFNTDTGETGTSRTYDIPGTVTGHAAIGQICATGVADVSVKRASCGMGQVTIEFSADPGNDHKLSLMITTPDKNLA